MIRLEFESVASANFATPAFYESGRSCSARLGKLSAGTLVEAARRLKFSRGLWQVAILIESLFEQQ